MSRFRRTQDQISYLDDLPMSDPAVLAWALARVVDQRVWEVRVARFGVTVYPRKVPPISYVKGDTDD
jgi:hypothetical protein